MIYRGPSGLAPLHADSGANPIATHNGLHPATAARCLLGARKQKGEVSGSVRTLGPVLDYSLF